MHVFTKNVSHIRVNIHNILSHDIDVVHEMLRIFLGLLADASIRASTPLHAYTLEHIEEAYRFLQSGKGFGKVLVEVNRESSVLVSSMVFGFSSEQLTTNRWYKARSRIIGCHQTLHMWLPVALVACARMWRNGLSNEVLDISFCFLARPNMNEPRRYQTT
jgi:hypothetical protein